MLFQLWRIAATGDGIAATGDGMLFQLWRIAATGDGIAATGDGRAATGDGSSYDRCTRGLNWSGKVG
jgi:hypothetical protein